MPLLLPRRPRLRRGLAARRRPVAPVRHVVVVVVGARALDALLTDQGWLPAIAASR